MPDICVRDDVCVRKHIHHGYGARCKPVLELKDRKRKCFLDIDILPGFVYIIINDV